jgi:hypothetical protein
VSVKNKKTSHEQVGGERSKSPETESDRYSVEKAIPTREYAARAFGAAKRLGRSMAGVRMRVIRIESYGKAPRESR